VNARLAADGWTVLRFWDFELERDLDRCVAKVRATIGAHSTANAVTHNY